MCWYCGCYSGGDIRVYVCWGGVKLTHSHLETYLGVFHKKMEGIHTFRLQYHIIAPTISVSRYLMILLRLFSKGLKNTIIHFTDIHHHFPNSHTAKHLHHQTLTLLKNCTTPAITRMCLFIRNWWYMFGLGCTCSQTERYNHYSTPHISYFPVQSNIHTCYTERDDLHSFCFLPGWYTRFDAKLNPDFA